MRAFAVILAVVALAACGSPPPPPAAVPAAPVVPPVAERLEAAAPGSVGMAANLPARLDSILDAAIAAGITPGAAVAVGRHGRMVHLAGRGRTDWADDAPDVTPATLYDLASLTKVIATTTAAMLLEEDGRLHLDAPIGPHLPELTDTAKHGLTPRLLLEHRAGLRPWATLWRNYEGREAFLAAIDSIELVHEPATETAYSDLGLILLQLAVERIEGAGLDVITRNRLFGPLGMLDTGFNPPAAERSRIAPTEVDTARGGLVQGVVHDENALAIGGVSGHAGLFGSARDLAIFAQMLLNGGWYGDAVLLQPATVARWTAPQVAGSSRALGWDTPSGRSSAGRYFSPRSFGHTGFTGTSMWVDPGRDLFVVLLTNRVNPTREETRHIQLRRDIADAVQESILDAPLVDWEARRW
jgi:CubicO group peptidase (beta-lactamase class C family)